MDKNKLYYLPDSTHINIREGDVSELDEYHLIQNVMEWIWLRYFLKTRSITFKEYNI